MTENDDFWKCPKHPSRRHRVGICAACLRDRLLHLCPNCANALPCPCSDSISSYSSSTSSSSTNASSIGAIGRVSALIDSEPSFRRSTSAAVPFLSSRFSDRCVGDSNVPHVPNRKSSVWSSVFHLFKSDVREDVKMKTAPSGIARSKSVSVWRASLENGKGEKGSLGNNNNKGWHFPSPMKVFRQSKPRSPLYRG